MLLSHWIFFWGGELALFSGEGGADLEGIFTKSHHSGGFKIAPLYAEDGQGINSPIIFKA